MIDCVCWRRSCLTSDRRQDLAKIPLRSQCATATLSTVSLSVSPVSVGMSRAQVRKCEPFSDVLARKLPPHSCGRVGMGHDMLVGHESLSSFLSCSHCSEVSRLLFARYLSGSLVVASMSPRARFFPQLTANRSLRLAQLGEPWMRSEDERNQ